MKSIIVIVVMLGSLLPNAFGSDCYRVVLDDFSRDSNSFQIYNEDVAALFEKEPEKAAVMAISALERVLECTEKSFQQPVVKCNDIVAGNPLSRVCYAEVAQGYFFISIDMLDKTNITFNRWD